MKKIYLIPQTTIVNVELQGRLLVDSLKISNEEYDGNAMSKGRGSWDEVWDDEE